MKRTLTLLLPTVIAGLAAGCRVEQDPIAASGGGATPASLRDAGATVEGAVEVATVAGGCFWCIEAPFEKVPGVISAVSGYTGGHVADPEYRDVGRGTTGHTEAVQITYDTSRLTYADVLEIFWRQFDPTDGGGSFVDRGSQYRPGIFTHDEEQRRIAEASRDALAASGRFDKPLATEITPLEVFYPAEEYHQDFYKKDPGRYQSYRRRSRERVQRRPVRVASLQRERESGRTRRHDVRAR